MELTFSAEQDQYLQICQARAYYRGIKEGIKLYAHWKNGEQFVGTTGKTLGHALYELDKEEERVLAKFRL